MKISNFFSKFSREAQKEKKNFLVLKIDNESIQAAVWTVVDKKIKVLRLGSVEEWENKKELLKAADSAITSASEEISPEPKEIIFGLPPIWVKGEDIVVEKKRLLANLCQKLELKPVGFVISLEALITYLRSQQGTPPSAIFVCLEPTEIIVSLVHLGKLVDSQQVARSQDLALDIKEGLARFKIKSNFPARMILFDGLTDFEEAKQQIISFDWLAELPFLHFPKVESFSTNFVMRAIAIAGGGEVARALGFEVLKIAKEEIDDKKTNKRKEWKIQGAIKETEKKTIKKKEIGDFSSQDSALPVVKRASEVPEEKEENIEKFGFIEGKDVRQLIKKDQQITVEEEREEIKNEEKELEKKGNFLVRKRERSSFALSMNPLVNILKYFLKKKIIFLALFLPVLFVGLLLAFLFLSKAEITLYLVSQNLEEEVSFKLSSDAKTVNKEARIIPAQELITEIEGEKQKESSGEKLVGEKAQGEVVIYNKTEVEQTFPQGTVLIGEDNLKFILNEEVTVASRSTETKNEGAEIIWGKATAGVAAASVGEESNVEAGGSFDFEDYSSNSFAAKTEEGLSGGTSEMVKVVTKEDREGLLEELREELEEKAKDELQSELSEDKIILDKIVESEILDEDFNREAGDEGEDLKLKLKASAVTFSFAKGDLEEFLKEALKDVIPQEFILAQTNFQTEVEKAEIVDEEVEVEMVVRADLIPNIEKEKLKGDLAGKKTREAEQYLFSLPNFARAQIDIYPSVLGKLKTLPRLAKNIDIKVEFQ